MSQRLQSIPQLVVDLRGVEPFGAPSYIQPEGRYLSELQNVEFEQARSGNGINIVFKNKLAESGFEGSNYEHQLWVPNVLAPAPGMDNKMVQAIEIARRRLVSALLSFGYTQQQIDSTNALPIGNPTTWLQAPGGRRYYILVEHKWGDVVINQTTKQPILDERTNRYRHHVNDEVRFVTADDYVRAQPPRRDVKSAIQMLAERGEYPMVGGQQAATPAPQMPYGVGNNGAPAGFPGAAPGGFPGASAAGGFAAPAGPAPAAAAPGFPGAAPTAPGFPPAQPATAPGFPGAGPMPNGTFPGPNPQAAQQAFAGFPR